MTDLVANVIFAEPNEQLRAAMDDAVEAGYARRDGGMVWFDREGYFAAWDEDDPDSRPLFVMYAAADGSAASVLAEDCADVGELERRVYRDLADEFTIDDHGVAAKVERSGGSDS